MPKRVFTPHEERLLDTLGPHTRLHARQLLESVRTLRITSARRSVQHNASVGGVPNSRHLTGRAADFAGSRLAIRTGVSAVNRLRVGNNCTGPEFVLDEGDHLHVEW